MYSYTPKGVCSRRIDFDIVDGKVRDVHFEGGCNGNGKGVASLAEGMDASELIKRLSDIKCGMKNTSCPAQLAKAVELAQKEQTEQA